MLALPLTGMSSPHQQRCRTAEAGTSTSECAQEQWDPLGGGEAPDEDQHDGVTVRAQQALEVIVAIGDRAGHGGLVPTLRVLDEPAPQQGAALSAGDRSGTERVRVHAVRNRRHPLSVDPQHLDGRRPVIGRDDDQMVGGCSLLSGAERATPRRAATAPNASFCSSSPPGPSSWRHVCEVRPCPRRHAGQRRAHRVGERDAFVHRLQELELRAVEVGDDDTFGPAAAHSVVLRRQVMQVEDVGLRCPSSTKRWLPHRRTDARPEQVAPLPTTRPVRPRGLRRTDASAPAPRSRFRPSRTPARRRSSRGTALRCQRRT